MAEAAREARRKKILENSQRRLDLLLGAKKTLETETSYETTTSTDTDLTKKTDNFNEKTDDNDVDELPEIPGAATEDKSLATHECEIKKRDSSTEKIQKLVQELPKAKSEIKHDENLTLLSKINGSSYIEFYLFISMALLTTILANTKLDVIISKNALLPFFTFQLIHFALNHKYIKSTNAQFQTYIALLRLCGISERSLSKMMHFFNMAFIFIDNFVIYSFSFIVINIFSHYIFAI